MLSIIVQQPRTLAIFICHCSHNFRKIFVSSIVLCVTRVSEEARFERLKTCRKARAYTLRQRNIKTKEHGLAHQKCVQCVCLYGICLLYYLSVLRPVRIAGMRLYLPEQGCQGICGSLSRTCFELVFNSSVSQGLDSHRLWSRTFHFVTLACCTART